MASFKINGQETKANVEDDMPLLWFLRDHLKLNGTKFGCGVAQCGACTVHIDGQARRSCVTPIASVDGSDIMTIEGLSLSHGDGSGLHPVQAAWIEAQAPQCGYCQSGQIMQAVALLQESPDPTDAEIEASMAGNLCRRGDQACRESPAGGSAMISSPVLTLLSRLLITSRLNRHS